jgi:hypothetical protein
VREFDLQHATLFPKIVIGPNARPEIVGQTEKSRQPQVDVGGHGGPSFDDLVDPVRRSRDFLDEQSRRQVHLRASRRSFGGTARSDNRLALFSMRSSAGLSTGYRAGACG